ncbi:hypothetical protein VN12_04085 [Pirellula sp. SH-Sr6A]|uniref:hypothetical protein n=1 Tax=Pirellula sp. SH-Sr6A TaxID=1632865 RepID=UPI00078C0EC0|nr:hypothetical protein [Pirellula sp. SH-Sr6A]AMV31273.1 hypothetical protein VN12_04085 [Pirellula sp. SH-Sr6A]
MRIQTFVMGFVDMKRAAIQRVAKCQAEGLCLSCLEPLDPGKTVVRGCHMRCAKATYRMIADGRLTDEQQVQAGEWLPASKGGRKPTLAVSKKASALAT